jgi:hypothetical protein
LIPEALKGKELESTYSFNNFDSAEVVLGTPARTEVPLQEILTPERYCNTLQSGYAP